MMARIVISVLVLIVPLHSFAGSARESASDAQNDCQIINTCSIEYDHLATQESDPFLFSGRPMNSEHPRWSQYRRAIRRFPDVNSCLIEEEKEKSNPNLLLVDWLETGTEHGAEVCIFLIARSLGTIERHEQWLSFHNFRITGMRQVFAEGFTPRFETQRVSIVSGFWTVEQYRALNPSWFSRLTGLETVHIYGVQIQYSDQQLVVGVNASTSSTLN